MSTSMLYVFPVKTKLYLSKLKLLGGHIKLLSFAYEVKGFIHFEIYLLVKQTIHV